MLRRWFGLSSPVSRGFYAASGVGLMLGKYLVDAIFVWSDAFIRAARTP